MARSDRPDKLDLNQLLRDPFFDRDNPDDVRAYCRDRIRCSRARLVMLKFGEPRLAIDREEVRFHFVVFRPTSEGAQSRFLVYRTSHVLWLCRKIDALRFQAEAGLEALHRRIARERERAQSRALKASELAIVAERIRALLALVAALARWLADPAVSLPLPRVLAAGGKTLAFAPLD